MVNEFNRKQLAILAKIRPAAYDYIFPRHWGSLNPQPLPPPAFELGYLYAGEFARMAVMIEKSGGKPSAAADDLDGICPPLKKPKFKIPKWWLCPPPFPWAFEQEVKAEC